MINYQAIKSIFYETPNFDLVTKAVGAALPASTFANSSANGKVILVPYVNKNGVSYRLTNNKNANTHYYRPIRVLEENLDNYSYTEAESNENTKKLADSYTELVEQPSSQNVLHKYAEKLGVKDEELAEKVSDSVQLLKKIEELNKTEGMTEYLKRVSSFQKFESSFTLEFSQSIEKNLSFIQEGLKDACIKANNAKLASICGAVKQSKNFFEVMLSLESSEDSLQRFDSLFNSLGLVQRDKDGFLPKSLADQFLELKELYLTGEISNPEYISTLHTLNSGIQFLKLNPLITNRDSDYSTLGDASSMLAASILDFLECENKSRLHITVLNTVKDDLQKIKDNCRKIKNTASDDFCKEPRKLEVNKNKLTIGCKDFSVTINTEYLLKDSVLEENPLQIRKSSTGLSLAVIAKLAASTKFQDFLTIKLPEGSKTYKLGRNVNSVINHNGSTGFINYAFLTQDESAGEDTTFETLVKPMISDLYKSIIGNSTNPREKIKEYKKKMFRTYFKDGSFDFDRFSPSAGIIVKNALSSIYLLPILNKLADLGGNIENITHQDLKESFVAQMSEFGYKCDDTGTCYTDYSKIIQTTLEDTINTIRPPNIQFKEGSTKLVDRLRYTGQYKQVHKEFVEPVFDLLYLENNIFTALKQAGCLSEQTRQADICNNLTSLRRQSMQHIRKNFVPLMTKQLSNLSLFKGVSQDVLN